MTDDIVLEKFRAIGARVHLEAAPRWASADYFTLGLRRTRREEAFVLRRGGSDVEVMDVDVAGRHLLLLASRRDEHGRRRKERFLCGHDERHWFVAGISGAAGTVAAARDSLKPARVRAAEDAFGLTARQRRARKTRASIRQGEWFFVPRPEVHFDTRSARKGRLRRRWGTAHVVQYLVEITPAFSFLGPVRYARGTVRHPDHRTVYLRCWHEVLPNTETADWGVD